jgi:RNA polymerase-binding transcription factor DksA
MDEKFVELAEEITRASVITGIEKAREKKRRPDNFDGLCECGDEVPPGRMGLGFFNCIVCQQQQERRAKFYKR